ncbi:MAG: hypothetical protein J0L51_08185 [Rhizobiales bacterium]|nr:hypothetical protein [Hyphomicrobiales bacterium]
MRYAFSRLACAGGMVLVSSFVMAAPRGYAIDIDPSTPTLGDLLDREAREAAARREQQKRSLPERPASPAALAPADSTGSIGGPRITATPFIPRGAVTVILPHPKVNAGRPIGHPQPRR